MSCPVVIIKFATAVQATYNVESLRSATSHGGSKKFLFPVKAESKDWSKILPTSCLNLLEALAVRVRNKRQSIGVREAD